MVDPHQIIKHPLTTEKAVKLIESQNKLVFIVDLRATKKQIKEAIEKLFEVRVQKVWTQITPKGKKKAYIKLDPKFPAIDVATKLGII
jgi:ribosomal protein uL23